MRGICKIARHPFGSGRISRGVGIALFGLTLLSASARAQVGDLLVAPTRVVFDGRTRTAEVALMNVGTKTARYRISFVRMRMTEDGKMEEVKEPAPGEVFADELVRFSPREVVLEPRVSQSVRMQLRKPADLPDGEYRSHLLFRAVPDASAAPTPGQAPPGGISIQLTPIYGISIPVIVRHGRTEAKATLSDVKLQPGDGDKTPPTVSLRISRAGNCSVYGDLTVTLVPKGGKERVIGQAKGVAVYTPNPSRAFELPVQIAAPQDLAGGRLTVAYRAKPEDGGAVLAETTQALP